jgi:hypothetical protein
VAPSELFTANRSAYDTARRRALARLREAHPEEYAKYLAQEQVARKIGVRKMRKPRSANGVLRADGRYVSRLCFTSHHKECGGKCGAGGRHVCGCSCHG